MRFSEYQNKALKTAIYPREYKNIYPLLGLVGEVGEYANKYKKVLRDGKEFDLDDQMSELGDILWYFSALCTDAGFNLDDVADYNLRKLFDRQDRGVLGGSGDNR